MSDIIDKLRMPESSGYACLFFFFPFPFLFVSLLLCIYLVILLLLLLCCIVSLVDTENVPIRTINIYNKRVY